MLITRNSNIWGFFIVAFLSAACCLAAMADDPIEGTVVAFEGALDDNASYSTVISIDIGGGDPVKVKTSDLLTQNVLEAAYRNGLEVAVDVDVNDSAPYQIEFVTVETGATDDYLVTKLEYIDPKCKESDRKDHRQQMVVEIDELVPSLVIRFEIMAALLNAIHGSDDNGPDAVDVTQETIDETVGGNSITKEITEIKVPR